MTVNEEQLELIQAFVQESRESLDRLEPVIIEMGNMGGNKDLLHEIFRLFHSIKGSAGFLDLENIAKVSHAAENLLDLIRSGELEMKVPDHVNLLIESADFVRGALEFVEGSYQDKDTKESAVGLTERLHEAVYGPKEAPPAPPEPAVVAQPEPPPVPEPAAAPVISLSDEEEKVVSHAAHQIAMASAPETPQFKITKEMVSGFVEASEELLQQLEEKLMEWLRNPADMGIFSEVFRLIHTFKGNCGFYGFVDLAELTHHMESAMDKIKMVGGINRAPLVEMFLKIKDTLRDGIADISNGGEGRIMSTQIFAGMLEDMVSSTVTTGVSMRMSGDENLPRIGEILVQEGVVTNEDVQKALDIQKKPVGEILVDIGATTTQVIEDALHKQVSRTTPAVEKKPQVVVQQDIRVNLAKLDGLINTIGELVIAKNMLLNNPDLHGLKLKNFEKAAQHTSKIVRDLQEMAMTIRMIPVSGLFRRMIRLVHDLSARFRKKVDFQIYGEETEMDKTIIEVLSDPLVHMIRNALDHGIERPEERLLADKPETGTLCLSARNEEGEVWITIEDDGRGLRRDRILAKAIEMGLVEGDGSDKSDNWVYQLIFHPGFSTAEKVSDVSGRGVGMDVVKRNLEKLKCKIDVHSKPGQGAKFIMRIPLTLAIIDGMYIRIGKSRYILPMLSIRESFRPQTKAVTRSPDGQEVVRVREEFIPVVRLHELHKIEPDSYDLDKGILVVLESMDRTIALFVDEILGQQQTVVKGLSNYTRHIGNMKGVSGCTILGNGDVSLILDVSGLMDVAMAEPETVM